MQVKPTNILHLRKNDVFMLMLGGLPQLCKVVTPVTPEKIMKVAICSFVQEQIDCNWDKEYIVNVATVLRVLKFTDEADAEQEMAIEPAKPWFNLQASISSATTNTK